MLTRDQLLESLREECKDDHVGLWRVVRAVREDLGVSRDSEVRRETGQVLRSLLNQQGMRVGRPTPDGRGFLAWQLPPEEAVQRILSEWDALGHDPDIGDVAWLTAEEQG